MSTAIDDQAAITFASSFYQTRSFGRSIKDAFDLAHNAIALEVFDDATTPQCICSGKFSILPRLSSYLILISSKMLQPLPTTPKKNPCDAATPGQRHSRRSSRHYEC